MYHFFKDTMTKIYPKILIFFLFVFLTCSPSPPKNKGSLRVISLAPSLTEMVYALGADNTLIAVSDYCKYPAQAQKKEKVGGLFNPNLEKIMALKPDLILATQSFASSAQKLASLTGKVVLLPEKTISDIYLDLDSLGVLLKRENKAQQLAQAIRDSLQKYRADKTGKRPKVMLVLGRDPGTARNVGVSGPGAFIDELLNWCGGQNAFADLRVSYSAISREAVLARNPDIIIEFRPDTLSAEQLAANRDEWKSFERINAYRNRHIYVISGNHYLIPGPRVYRLARQLSRIIKKRL